MSGTTTAVGITAQAFVQRALHDWDRVAIQGRTKLAMCPDSIGPQAFQRIDPGRAPRRHVAGQQRDRCQDGEDAGKSAGSVASTPYRMLRISEPSAKPPSTPTMAPTPTSRALWPTIILNTSPSVAPRAIRIPISDVRWLTAYAVIP
jgi:hypothetical protein